jgi:hypothetical protein
MVSAEECRKLANQYLDQANRSGVSPRMANVLRDMSWSFAGLASQYDMLRLIAEEESRQQLQ